MSRNSMLPKPFHGPHVAPLRAVHEKVVWRKPTARCARVRVRSHTCECRSVIYELCSAGGLMFIRRTARMSKGMDVRETEWLLTAKAAVPWQRLLVGQAR
ncbi:hypothetical protein Mth01_50820 [Sphaerimonospora thailandensis]|uniref:Uncharacterized protein n=1 Tax=Sphaerimonospora thailandensis TaxID=795644 RepID=A0A8J3W111_9ACTN|nr:hypothetical protein Mth01_50820 [Sphaerimonospora thailandensis]